MYSLPSFNRTPITRISNYSESDKSDHDRGKKIPRLRKKMFVLKCLKSAVMHSLIVLMLLFFNYAFFNCSYVFFLMYDMAHSKKNVRFCSVFFDSPK